MSVCGFAVMDNHLHVLGRVDPGVADTWSDEDVVRRWIAVFTPATLDVDDPPTVQAWVNDQCQDSARVARYRERLQNIGWFMKALKESLARLANKEDDCKGTFWEARYKSIAILNEEALLATCASIDLNTVAARIAETPKASDHTSIKQRVGHARSTGSLEKVRLAASKSVTGAEIEGGFEQSHWLCPMQDRRPGERNRLGESNDFGPGATRLGASSEWWARVTRLGTLGDVARMRVKRKGTLAGLSLAQSLEPIDRMGRVGHANY